MKIVSLETNSKNSYHTINEKSIGTENGFMIGESIITRFTLEEINQGDILKLHGTDYTVNNVEKRDHKGIFKNPSHAKNSFFKAECSFKRVIK